MDRCLFLMTALAVLAACGDLELVRYVGFDADVDALDASADTAAPEDVPTTCEALDESPVLCGGDPTGLWEVSLWCPVASGWDPFDGLCPDVQTVGEGSAIGTLEIAADGYWEFAWAERTVDIEFSFDLACFGGSTTPCNGAFVRGECEVVSPRCECTASQRVEDFVERGAWTSSGGALSVALDGDTIDHTYCVDPASGSLYLLRLASERDDPFRMLGRRIEAPLR